MKQAKAHSMAEPFIEDRIFSFLPQLKKTARFLDIATGEGYILEMLHDRGFSNLYAADLDDENFKLSKTVYHFKKTDANKKWPYADGFFDVVVSSETIEHLENPSHFMREVSRVLKPKGYLLLSTPSVEGVISRIYFFLTGILAFHTTADYLNNHITVLPSYVIERLAHRAGLRMLAKTYSSFYIPLIAKRITHPFFLTKFWGWVAIYKFQK